MTRIPMAEEPAAEPTKATQWLFGIVSLLEKDVSSREATSRTKTRRGHFRPTEDGGAQDARESIQVEVN